MENRSNRGVEHVPLRVDVHIDVDEQYQQAQAGHEVAHMVLHIANARLSRKEMHHDEDAPSAALGRAHGLQELIWE